MQLTIELTIDGFIKNFTILKKSIMGTFEILCQWAKYLFLWRCNRTQGSIQEMLWYHDYKPAMLKVSLLNPHWLFKKNLDNNCTGAAVSGFPMSVSKEYDLPVVIALSWKKKLTQWACSWISLKSEHWCSDKHCQTLLALGSRYTVSFSLHMVTMIDYQFTLITAIL